MLVDTGANPTIISSQLAAKLRLSGTDAVMAMMNGTVHFQKTELPTLQLGPLRHEQFPVLVQNLDFIQKDLGERIDAIIGMDVLSAMNFTIDYKHKRLIFGYTDLEEDDELDFADGPPFMVVNVMVGEAQLRFLVDTGTSSMVLFDSMMRGGLRETSLGTGKDGVNIAGRFATREVLLSNVQLSKTRVAVRSAFLTHDQPGWGQTFDGLLGPTAIGLTRITFDFKAGKLRWKQ